MIKIDDKQMSAKLKLAGWTRKKMYLLEQDDYINCSWSCPKCKKMCGGYNKHAGEHQCPVHYIVSYQNVEEKND